MKVLKFSLSGRTAFFKKPDVNSYYYFSYGNIHKVALMGMLGATLGLDGYSQQQDNTYPSFYECLKDLKVAIRPEAENGYLPKKIQAFNNSVGYASKERGGNLIVKEQWLENPAWTIYILLEENKICEEIKTRFQNSSFVYIPYLGKNDHFADIQNIEVLEMPEATAFSKIDSLFMKESFRIVASEDDLWGDEEEEFAWRHEERLPVALEEISNQYITKPFIFTNMNVEMMQEELLLMDNEKAIYFF